MRAIATTKCRAADFKSQQMRRGYIEYSERPSDRHNPNKWDSSDTGPYRKVRTRVVWVSSGKAPAFVLWRTIVALEIRNSLASRMAMS